MFRNRSVDVHQFAMVPKAEIPRSSFRMQKTYKTTFGGLNDAMINSHSAMLYPIFVEEVLPGDTFNCRMTAFCRMATPLFPIMDNLYLESFFFFVPNRLVWENWDRFMGERRPNPNSSIDYTIPQCVSPVGGYPVCSIYDYMGLPTVGQVNAGSGQITHSALPLRAYNLIWNEWFRDQNIFDSVQVQTGDTDTNNYFLLARGKRHDYFTGCLPFPQKGQSVQLPIGTTAPVSIFGTGESPTWTGFGLEDLGRTFVSSGVTTLRTENTPGTTFQVTWGGETGLAGVADLSAATAATINQLRQSFQVQKLLERDARGGTRYTEIIRAHFGVISPDARLQRPEYLGGGSTPVNINPVAQTSATAAEGSDTPQGNLAAIGQALMPGHGFTQSFTEHGYIIGLVNVRADLTYQQGLRRHWSRSTRYDYYFPVFAMLGEQAVLSKELYADGTAGDDTVFGYQERWAEYRYMQSEITGQFRSTYSAPLDAWHLAQRFTSRPVLNNHFMEDRPPMDRVLAVGIEAQGQEFLFDAFFDIRAARPLPMYSVPGLIDHF